MRDRPLILHGGVSGILLRPLHLKHQAQHLIRVIQLIGEWRPLQALQHFRRNARAVVPGKSEQLFALRLRRNASLSRCLRGVCRRRGSRGPRQLARNLQKHRPRQQVVPERSHVHVLIHQLAADDSIRTLLRENLLRIDQLRARRPRHPAVDLVDAAVGAKAQRIQIARRHEMLFRSGVVSLHPQAARHAELELGELIVDLCRRIIGLQRLRPRTGALEVSSLLQQRGPAAQIVRAQVIAVLRAKRSAIFQIRRHRADDHPRPRAPRRGNRVAQVLLEVRIRVLHQRRSLGHLLVEKHLHAAPLFFLRAHLREQLANARGTQRDSAANHVQVHASGSQRRARPIGADDFVVAGVNDENVGLLFGQALSDRQQDVRIDGNAARIHDFEFHLRIAGAQHDFQVAAEGVGRIGIAHGRRFSQNKNPECACRFFGRNRVGLRRLDHARRKKWRREKQVVTRCCSALHGARNGQVRRKPHPKQAQRRFAQDQQQHGRDDGCGDLRPQPLAARMLAIRRGLRGGIGHCGFSGCSHRSLVPSTDRLSRALSPGAMQGWVRSDFVGLTTSSDQGSSPAGLRAAVLHREHHAAGKTKCGADSAPFQTGLI